MQNQVTVPVNIYLAPNIFLKFTYGKLKYHVIDPPPPPSPLLKNYRRCASTLDEFSLPLPPSQKCLINVLLHYQYCWMNII